MRTATALLFAGLVGTLLAVPTANAGPICQSGYFPQQTYVQTYSAPHVAPIYTPYAVPVDTFYRVAPDLAAARVAQEAADAAIAKLKAELARQAAEQQAGADRAAQQQFQQQVMVVLQQLAAGRAPAPDAAAAELERLKAENTQMRATLEKIVREGRPPAGATGPTPPSPPPGAAAEPPPAVPKVEPPPPIPPGAAAPPVNPAKAELVSAVRKGFAANCMPCHSAGNAEHLTDLTAPERLTYEKLTDCFNRMVSNNPKFVMPKGKAPGSIPADLPVQVHELTFTAPHDPRLIARR